MVTLEPTEASVSFVSKQLLRFPWGDPTQQCGPLVCRIMLKTCRVGRYRSINAVANVAAKLRRQKPELCIRLLDYVVEELQWSMEHPAFKDQQRTLTVARLLGEMYCAGLASGQMIIQQLFLLINCGHEIPEALREASEKLASSKTDESPGEKAPVYNSASGVTQSIMEDEEMDEQELETKEESPEGVTTPVAVSRYSKFDPRVPSILDPQNSVFRVQLVCTLLEVVAKSLVSRNNLPKVEVFLVAFQRYLFTKTTLPTEVEFALLDTFDIIDSQWRKVLQDQKKKTENESSKDRGFPRYPSWIEAHNATVANEEAEAILEGRAQSRLEALAGNNAGGAEVANMANELMNEAANVLAEEEDFDSIAEDGMSVSVKDSLADYHEDDQLSGDEGNEDEDALDDQDGSRTGTADEDDSEDGYDDTDDESSEEEFDEQAYMKQLEAEAFEAELRRLTMDALEKGKSTARLGKVADTMPSGSQFIKKSNMDSSELQGPATTLSGQEGISFKLLKKGNKGKMEAKQFYVPKDTNLAAVATKQDDEAARERDMIKAKVLQYEAESADATGGNVYLEQEKLQVIRNRPLSMDTIDKNFGTTGGNLVTGPNKKTATSAGMNPNATGGRGAVGGGVFPGRGPVGRGSVGSSPSSGGWGQGRVRGRSSGRGLV